MRRGRGLWIAVVSVAAAVGVLLTGVEAEGDVTTLSGAAFGLAVRSGDDVLVAPTPGGVDGAATEPSDGYGPVARTALPVRVPGVLSVGVLEASTQGAGLSAPQGSGSAVSSARAGGLAVPILSLAVTAVESRCSAGDDGSAGSTALVGTLGAGGPLLGAPPPNTALEVPGLATAVANEQIVSTTPGQTSITVIGLHIQLLPGALGPGSALVDIVLAQSTCRANLTAPSPTATTALPRPVSPPTIGTPATIPPTSLTTPGAPTTSPAPASSAPPPPPSAPVPAAPERSSLSVSSAGGGRSGPPGATIDVSGSGYRQCDTVYLFFDETHIGTADADADGDIRKTRLSVPGDADPGAHRVTSSCHRSREPVHASTVFEVTSASVHRTALVTSVPEVHNVDLSGAELLRSTVIALGLLFMIAFPAELFNSTYEANYDEVRGWFGLRPKDPEEVRSGRQGLLFLGFCVVGGALYTLLSPDFDLSWSWLADVVGLGVAMAMITLTYDVPSLAYFRRFGEHPRLLVLPSTLVIAAACVALSRVIGFQPGYFYGVVAGLAFRRQVGSEVKGRLVAISALAVLALSAGTWLAWSPVSAAAGRSGASFWLLALDAFLAGIFWCGLDSMVLSLLPLRFLQGRELHEWNQVVWAILYGVTLFAFVHIMLRPSTGYVADSRIVPVVVAVGLFLAFAAFSFAFWGYFRFRRST